MRHLVGWATLLGAAFLAAFATSSARAGQACGPYWTTLDTGADHFVHALVEYDDGTGPALYAGGQFTVMGGQTVHGIARWTGSTWQSVGTGVAGSNPLLGVYALTVFDDGTGNGPELYAGGQFGSMDGVTAEGIAKWNGARWAPVGTGAMTPTPGSVRTLCVYDDASGSGPALYAGGNFAVISGVAANRVAKWNGTTWAPLGLGVGSSVYALAGLSDGNPAGPSLIAAGIFTSAGGQPVKMVARWRAGAWSAMGAGINALQLYALGVLQTPSGPQLFAGGFFGSPSPNVARWDGANWVAAGAGSNNGVLCFGAFNDGTGPALYAGGNFTSSGSVPTRMLAKWTGSGWQELPEPPNGDVRALCTRHNSDGSQTLFVGGAFSMVGATPASSIAQWNGCPACAQADLNCDGHVDGTDLGLLLSAWGVCNNCGADLNGDLQTDGTDLGIMLGEWTG